MGSHVYEEKTYLHMERFSMLSAPFSCQMIKVRSSVAPRKGMKDRR